MQYLLAAGSNSWVQRYLAAYNTQVDKVIARLIQFARTSYVFEVISYGRALPVMHPNKKIRENFFW